MAPSITGHEPPSYSSDQEKGNDSKAVGIESERRPSFVSETKVDHTHRQLKSRHIQLIGIGGTIGTVLYVRIMRESASFCPPFLLFPALQLVSMTLVLIAIFFFSCRFKLAMSSSKADLVACSLPLPIGVPLFSL